MSKAEELLQLQMVWPEHLLDKSPVIRVPSGYALRTFRPGDEPRFYEVMALSGWPGWNDEKLQPWLAKVLPDGWFMLVHKKRVGADGDIVATAMCLHNYMGIHPFQGELGWLASDPVHAGKGLGMVVCAAVTRRFIGAGYRNIRLYTEDFRLPAIKTYLKLGYVPVLYVPEMQTRWQAICGRLRWPFTPKRWPS